MPDVTKDRTELVAAAADELRLVDATETLEAADAVKIDGKIDGLLAELATRSIIYVADPEAIPIEVFNPLAQLLAIASEGVFGKPATPNQVREAIEERIRVIVNNIPATNRYLRVDRALLRPRRFTYADWRRG